MTDPARRRCELPAGHDRETAGPVRWHTIQVNGVQYGWQQATGAGGASRATGRVRAVLGRVGRTVRAWDDPDRRWSRRSAG